MTHNSKSEILQDKQLKICLTTVSQDDEPIYIVGNFNGWQVKDERFQLKKTKGNIYTLDIPDKTILPEILEYKYIKGGWEAEELDQYGNSVNNRSSYCCR